MCEVKYESSQGNSRFDISPALGCEHSPVTASGRRSMGDVELDMGNSANSALCARHQQD